MNKKILTLKQALANIERDNARLNIVMDRAADPVIGESDSPLENFSIAVKSNIAVAGLPFTAGIGAYRNRVAREDASAIATLRAAGATIVGTVNMEEAALGARTDNPHFGRTQNPLRVGYTPGGSSGGSAAAVAAQFARASLGTDTMGSCRIPAAYCGVVGFKPSFGRISIVGVEPLCSRLDHVGILANTVLDIQRLANIILTTSLAESMRPRRVINLQSQRYAVLDQTSILQLEPAVAKAYQQSLKHLSACGVTLLPRPIDQTRLAAARRAGLLLCEAALARTLKDVLDRNDAGVSNHLRSMIAFASSKNAHDLARANQTIDDTIGLEQTLLEGVDALLWPTAPQTAFSFDDETPSNQADFTCLANFTGSPAISLPLPIVDDALPAGLQIMKARGEDMALLDIASAIEAALG